MLKMSLLLSRKRFFPPLLFKKMLVLQSFIRFRSFQNRF